MQSKASLVVTSNACTSQHTLHIQGLDNDGYRARSGLDLGGRAVDCPEQPVAMSASLEYQAWLSRN